MKRRYGIPPELVPDFIALRGDPSDGLPGAKGIGEKTAADLLSRHGSLDEVLDGFLPESTPRIRGVLKESRDELLAFREIARLQEADVELPPDGPTDWKAAAAAAREYGMGRLADRLEKTAARLGARRGCGRRRAAPATPRPGTSSGSRAAPPGGPIPMSFSSGTSRQ